MDINTITELLIAVLPAIASILSVIGIAVKILKKFVNLQKEFADKTDYKEIQKCMSKVVDENMQLRKEINRLKSTIDHVYRPDGGDTNGKQNV